jgi:hypothetical protein
LSHGLTRFDPPFRQGALSHGQAELGVTRLCFTSIAPIGL